MKFTKGYTPWNKGKTKKDYPQMSNSGVKEGNIPWIIGKHHTQKSKDKMNESHKGQIPWNKNVPCSEKTKEKNRQAHLGQPAWNKGLTKETDERVRKMSEGKKGKTLPKEWREKLSLAHIGIQAGENHWNWKNGITPLNNRIRTSFKYRLWHSDVFTRDYFTCQECNQRSGKLNAHHIESFTDIMELNDIKTYEQAMNCEELWNINNGITLCQNCHNNVKIKELKKIGTHRI